MAALARLPRGLRAFGISRVRALTGSADEQVAKIPLVKSACDPKCCYIVSRNGISEFPIESFIPVKTFVKGNPIFDEVPFDRLVLTVDSDKPYRTSEKSRKWIRSGYILPHLCGLKSLNLLDPFFEDNVGILKGCDVLCFKQLYLVSKCEAVDPTCLVKNSSFSAFFKGLVKDEYDCLAKIPKGLAAVIDVADLESLSFKEIIYHPEFMADHMLSFLFLEYQRLVRRQLPTRGHDEIAMQIMDYVHSEMGSSVSGVCGGHNLMRQWCQSHFQVDGTGQKTGLGALIPKEKKVFQEAEEKDAKGTFATS